MTMPRALLAAARVLRKLVLISLPSLIGAGLVFELGARFVLPTSDYPRTVFDPRLGNLFAAGQEGHYVKGPRAEIRARYRINAEGWNATHDFSKDRTPGTLRVAVIGDSFTEALQVDVDRAFPALLEQSLERQLDREVEVYPFGHSGASLVQYLAVLREEVCAYAPDVVLFMAVHNDFEDSVYPEGRKDNWRLRRDGDGWDEVPPEAASNLALKQTVRRFAAARYLVMNLDLVSRIGFVGRIYYGDARSIRGNVDVTAVSRVFAAPGSLESLVRYVLSHARDTAARCGARLMVAMDADRIALYSAEPSGTGYVHDLIREFTETVRAVAGGLSIPFMDLTPAFRDAWQHDRQPFEWRVDAHWNARGHRVVADALTALIAHDLERGPDVADDAPGSPVAAAQ